MPKNADTHIQNTAPAPPTTMALLTPAILPTPMVAARAVDKAWNWEMDFSCFAVYGDQTNIKITTKEDLDLFEGYVLMKQRRTRDMNMNVAK